MPIEYAQVLDRLAEWEGRDVSVAIDWRPRPFKPQVVLQGRLGAMEMVPEITDGRGGHWTADSDAPVEERHWERGVAYFPVGGGHDAGHDRPGFYLSPAEFEEAKLEVGVVIYERDLELQVVPEG